MQETKPITKYRQSLKERIVTAAMLLFAKHGVKAVKMDDIASSLGISKRTLYELYENKEVLLYEGVRSYHANVKQQVTAYALQASDVMDIVLYVYRMKSKEFQTTSPHFYEDIQKYPRVTEFLTAEQQKNHEQVLEFMERGVAEGYFRKDINYRLINHLFEAMGSYIRDHHLIQQFSSDELFDNILFVTLRGICTQKGIDALEDFWEVKMQENAHFL